MARIPFLYSLDRNSYILHPKKGERTEQRQPTTFNTTIQLRELDAGPSGAFVVVEDLTSGEKWRIYEYEFNKILKQPGLCRDDFTIDGTFMPTKRGNVYTLVPVL